MTYASDSPEPAPSRALSIETEAQVLGAMILSPAACRRAIETLQEDVFSEPLHGRMFEVLRAIVSDGGTVGKASLAAHWNAGWQDQIGPGVTLGQYFARLAANGATTLDVERAGEHLTCLWGIREIADAAARPDLSGPYSPSKMLRTVLDDVDVVRARIASRTKRAGSLDDEMTAMLERAQQALKGLRTCLASTGYRSLDALTNGGVHPERVVTIGGRPSMGKSAFALELATNVSGAGVPTAFFSLEMSGQEIAARACASLLERRKVHVPYGAFLSNRIREEQLAAACEVRSEFRAMPLHIDHGGGLTFADIAMRAEAFADREERQGRSLGMIVIDHLQILKAPSGTRGRYDLITEATGAAVSLSKHLQCTVLLLSQLNRQLETRDDKRPSQADLRESGSIEQDSDTIAFCYRPAVYIERSPEYRQQDPEAIDQFEATKSDFELIVEKNRQGPPNRVLKFWCDMSRNAVREMAHG